MARSGDGRLSDRYLDDAERQAIGEICEKQRHGHVVDRHVAFRPSFERTAMGVTMKNSSTAIPVDRLSSRDDPRNGLISGGSPTTVA